jgi:hypothetical protein
MATGRPWIIRRLGTQYLADWDGREATWTDDEEEALEFVDELAAKRIKAAIPWVKGERVQAFPRETQRERREWLRETLARKFALRLLNAEFFLDGSRNPHYVDLPTSGSKFGREVDRLAAEILARRVRVKLDELPRPAALSVAATRYVRQCDRGRPAVASRLSRATRISED